MVVFVRKEDPRFLLVADKTVDLLQKVTPLHGNAHVGNRGIYLFVVFLCKIQDLLYSVFFQIKFNGNAIAVLKNFIAFFGQQVGQGIGVRPLGDGGHHIALIIEHSQPGAHAVRHALDIAGVHLVARQFINHILPCASVIHQAYKGGAQLHVGDILRHIAAHTAVYLFYPPGVAPARNIGGKGVPLDINKNCADDNDPHAKRPSLPRVQQKTRKPTECSSFQLHRITVNL